MKHFSPRHGRPRAVGNIVTALLRDLGVDKAVRQQQALTEWPRVVGEHISRVTVPEQIANGRLVVRVSNPTWRVEVFHQREQIRERLNAALGAADVREIVLV